MITVISHELLTKGDVSAILESTGAEYVHVSSKPKNVAVINLGMTPQQFSIFQSNSALNIFGKSFAPSTLAKLGTEICVISDGTLTSEDFSTLSNEIALLVGKMTVIGVGIGKELVMAATGVEQWQVKDNLWSNSDSNAWAVDSYEQLNDLGIL